MSTLHTLRLPLVCAALSLVAGCATPPVSTPERILSVPMGTVTTYHRKSSGSLGNFDGKVVWTHSPATWQGRPAIAFGAPQAGVGLYDPVDFKLLATQTADGKPAFSYDPPVGYQWPLEVGKAWKSKHQLTVHANGRTLPMEIDWKVESYGDVTVPAGTYKAYKVTWVDNYGESDTRWISPASGLATVKRHVERPARPPQGAGVLDAELLSAVPPAK